MNRLIMSNEIESVILKLSTNISPGPDGFTGELYQIFKEKLTSILLKLFQKFAKEVMFLNSFHDACITLIQKPNKDITKKENCRPILLKNIDAKILNAILTSPN